MAGQGRTSVRGRVVQCSKIELYYTNIVDTTTHPTVLESRGVMNVLWWRGETEKTRKWESHAAGQRVEKRIQREQSRR